MQNFTDLRAAVQRRIARTDLNDQVPDWVQMAEKEISNTLRTNEVEAFSGSGNETTISPIEGYAALPAGFISVADLRPVEAKEKQLTYVPPERIFDLQYANRADGYSVYTIRNNKLMIQPAPESTVWTTPEGTVWTTPEGGFWGFAKEFIMRYVSEAEAPLSEANQTNALFPRYSDLYFYGTLWQAYEYMRNIPQASYYYERMRNKIEEHNINYAAIREGEAPISVPPSTVA